MVAYNQARELRPWEHTEYDAPLAIAVSLWGLTECTTVEYFSTYLETERIRGDS